MEHVRTVSVLIDSSFALRQSIGGLILEFLPPAPEGRRSIAEVNFFFLSICHLAPFAPKSAREPREGRLGLALFRVEAIHYS